MDVNNRKEFGKKANSGRKGMQFFIFKSIVLFHVLKLYTCNT